jgi:hypothetical protein
LSEQTQKRPVVVFRPRYDPAPTAIYDPDPDPSPLVFAILLLIGVAGAGTLTNPNVWNNLLMTINPKLAELEEERQQSIQDAIKLIGMILLAIGGIMLIYYIWHWKVKKREAKAARRRRRH